VRSTMTKKPQSRFVPPCLAPYPTRRSGIAPWRGEHFAHLHRSCESPAVVDVEPDRMPFSHPHVARLLGKRYEQFFGRPQSTKAPMSVTSVTSRNATSPSDSRGKRVVAIGRSSESK